MTKNWIRRRQRDYYHKLAKTKGYRSRAAWKLKQIDERFGILKDAKVIVDLGASPGGWLQVESEAVGDNGFVLGVDLDEIEPLPQTNIKTIQGDIAEMSTLTSIKSVLPGSVDVLSSDVSPNVSGIWEVDHARQIDLARASLEIAKEVLRLGGNAVIKVFQGSMFKEFFSEVKQFFQYVNAVKPAASRKRSAELYIVAQKLIRKKLAEDYSTSC